MKKIKTTERGFAGHFCASRSCLYRRNTLVEYGNKRIVVSSVGNYRDREGVVDSIGCNRWYETMVFWAKKVGSYWEADVFREINIKGTWGIFEEPKEDSDMKMDKIHDSIVKQIGDRLVKGKL